MKILSVTARIAIRIAAIAILAGRPAFAQFEDEPQIAVFVEMIELEESAALRLVRRHEAGSSAEVLRAAVEKRLEDGEATLVESIYARGCPGEEIRARSAEEFIYGTEGDPPENPNELALRNIENLGKFRGTPGAFAAFETRDTGAELSFKARSKGSGTIKITFKTELVTTLFKDYFARSPLMHPDNELRHKSMPRFATLMVYNEYELKSGKPILASVHKPIRYREERKEPEEDKGQADSKRVLVFVTAWILE